MFDHETLILGAGPAGTTAARLLAQRGVPVTVFDREAGPTFKIGESLLPEGIRLCHQLGLESELRAAGFQVKNGARFVLSEDGADDRFDFADALRAERQEFAYEVERIEFDALLARHAEAGGAEIRWGTAVRDVELRDDRVVVTLADGEQCTTRYLIDATGPAHFLARRLGVRRPYQPLRKVALYTHCSGVPRRDGREAGDITILWFPGGWGWVIPFANARSSIGIIADPAVVDGAGRNDEERFDAFCNQTACHRELFEAREQLWPVQRRADWSYRCESVAGARFVMLGDAGGFIDPVFSSGVYLGQQSAFLFDEMLAPALAAGELPDTAARDRFTARMRTALDRFLGLVHQFYDSRFVETVVRSRRRRGLRQSLTSLLAGDIYYDDNPIIRMGMV